MKDKNVSFMRHRCFKTIAQYRKVYTSYKPWVRNVDMFLQPCGRIFFILFAGVIIGLIGVGRYAISPVRCELLWLLILPILVLSSPMLSEMITTSSLQCWQVFFLFC